MEKIVSTVENDKNVKAVVLISGKPDNFIAGADIRMLSECKSSAELTTLSHRGQQMLDRLAAGKPTVAAINGVCLGGGLEVALACHYRIASTHPKTSLGVPEVMLGLLPGAGGTQRLPRLVGMQAALDMMLTGKNIKPQRALKMKLVDSVADPNALEGAAIQAAKKLAEGKLKPNREPKSLVEKATRFALEKVPFGRDFALNKAKEMVTKMTLGNYPAPFDIIECVRTGLASGMEAGLKEERERFGKLGQTDVSKALVSIYFGQTAAKKNRFGDVSPQEKVKTVAVLGAGLMGAGITQVTADKGLRVLLKDATLEGLARGEKQIFGNLDQKVKKRRMTFADRDKVMGNIVGLTDQHPWGQHFKSADLVIEAVFEDIAVKHKVIQEVEKYLPEHAVFATNTSAIPIRDIAKASKRPNQVIGMHYFSPVDKMPLLEIIPHDKTDESTKRKAVDVGLKQGKTVIVVKDVPGFYVNRSLGPYSAEVGTLLKEGVDPLNIDKALKKFGFPVGPISLVDEVGVDVGYKVQTFLSAHLGVRMAGGDNAALKMMVDKGFLGRKTGAGFFMYPKDKKKGPKEINPEVQKFLSEFQTNKKNVSEEDIQMRMAGRFINEAAFCLQDGIIANAQDGDIGAVFGIGFPPFRGGPFRFLDSYGVQRFVDKMHSYRDQYGEHFTPAPLLVDYAKAGKRFHNN
eukprot:TRINITY_DN2460_c0_g1::TRINITY_DN2460_c0_g1_i1::g.8765::m.8765 TRINITY_DN2460_c0_g1::TRINITY_DN2460_c0_g1_i1::g.8765  ORF type:complete len:762 (+),score=307.57,sp/P40939/ECHA_HUMAN/49.93/0.0,ECH/PF00378.15/1.8e-65,3HCDH_N/PF02737.13/8.3e+02,3HCDH_N/PF02737.13/1.2e-54,3HCDH/PF00725.17/1.8e-23,3HCDH/PF00725.17/1.7e-05,DUF3798/PF12683.2/0.062,DUF3798/PF12683.2/1.2e+02,HSP33/PF01430.14/0.26,HSP33/PF01430.14/3.1e+03,NAD_binding_2/PF03446.10/5.4e+02,NAD_binding_2/PF03446.10/0.8 TRINITY_DN2460_c0_g1_i1